MRPHAETDKPDGTDSTYHGRSAENRFPRENRNHFGENRESREDQNVYLGMSEDPEEMLPQNRRTAGLRIEKVATQKPVNQQHDLRSR